MKKTLMFYLIVSVLISCQRDDLKVYKSNDNFVRKSKRMSGDPNNVVKGYIKIKLNSPKGNRMKVSFKSGLVQSNATQLNKLLNSIGAKEMKRLFPYAGKYEERTRKEGLHLWYVVKFDHKKSVRDVLEQASKLDCIDKVEQFPVLKNSGIIGNKGYLFTDKDLKNQWNLNNKGAVVGDYYKKGADINVFKAWEIETGKPNVIVCVVDGGIDYMHEDLKDSMHINTKEQNGVKGVDDDNNGYVDDVYGYNFYEKKGTIIPDRHATHVAGIIAARNNNAKGVCGVAGGDGTPNSGVRLISAQVFNDGKTQSLISSGQAIKYGADLGAVISQNSWAYGDSREMYESDKAAIDYFVKYAGCDNKGEQLPDSPIKGGLVVFSAGNDSSEYMSYPAAYDPVVAVASVGANLEKAFYSNWGDWVDIAAPGGDLRLHKGAILSTIPNNSYGYEQGTSMACPHVSGIAALVVSKYGKQGFTNDELRKRLLGGLRPFNIDKENPKYKGKLGLGYIDAFSALSENMNKKPKTPTSMSIEEGYTSLKIKWNAVSDQDDISPAHYNLFYSEKNITKANYKKAKHISVVGYGLLPGEQVVYLLEKLSVDTKYHLALEAVDRWGLVSNVIFKTGRTKKNNKIIITRESKKLIKISELEQASLKLKINEPDNQTWTYKVLGDQNGVDHKRIGDTLMFNFKGQQPLGRYFLRVLVTDSLGLTTEMSIPYQYYKNNPPKLIKSFDDLYIPINRVFKINLLNYFVDPEGGILGFSAESLSDNFSAIDIEKNIIQIRPNKLGLSALKLIVKDNNGKTLTKNIKIHVVPDDIVYLVYPVPVMDKLKIQLSNEVNNANLKICTVTGKTLIEKEFVTSKDSHGIVLDLSKLTIGNYIIQVKANGELFTKSIAKI